MKQGGDPIHVSTLVRKWILDDKASTASALPARKVGFLPALRAGRQPSLGTDAQQG